MGDDCESIYPFSQQERAEALSLLSIADGILLLKADELDQAIGVVEPKVLILGNEYKDKSDIQKTLTMQRLRGGSVQFHAGETHYATSDLLSGSERSLSQERIALFRAACQRQGIDHNQLVKATEAWGNTRLIVLGDTIVDQYSACEAIGMSAEAPLVVVRS